MPIPLPGGLSLRLFERVPTVDPQYDIVDVGIAHSNGDIDSIAVGGSFASLKRVYNNYADSVERDAAAEMDAEQAENDALAKAEAA